MSSLPPRVSLTVGPGSISCTAPAALPVRALSHRKNADGTTTIEIDFAIPPHKNECSLTEDALQSIVDQNYERIRDLVERSHKASARSVNTVTQRYTNKAVKAVFKRESSFTESEPSDLDVKFPPSPGHSSAKKRKSATAGSGQPSAKRVKAEVASGSGTAARNGA